MAASSAPGVLAIYDAAYESYRGKVAVGFVWKGIRDVLQKCEPLHTVVKEKTERELIIKPQLGGGEITVLILLSNQG